MDYKNSKEFLDSLVESGETVTITFDTKRLDGEDNYIMGTLIWNDEESIGVKYIQEFSGPQESIQVTSPGTIVKQTITPGTIVKQKIVTYFKSSIQSINTEWKEVKEEEAPF